MKKRDMKGTYLVNLHPEPEQLNANKNLLEINLQTGNERIVQAKNFRVELVFSVNGMLGFGTELIRQAINGRQNGLEKDLIFKSLNSITMQEVSNLYRGVYLTPDSAELIIRIKENLSLNKINNCQLKKEFFNTFLKKKEKQTNNVIENYLIDLYPNFSKMEEFEIDSKNLLEVRTQLIENSLIEIKNLKPIVSFSLTVDGMLEFGESLIRKVNDIKRRSLLTRISLNDSKFSMTLNANDIGAFLTHDSAELFIEIKNLDKIADLSNKFEKRKFNWQMYDQLNYVSDIFDREITIIAQSSIKKKIVKLLGGRKAFFSKNSWYLICDSDQILATKLQQLRDLGFMFSYGRSWNPAEVFCDLRDKGYVKGSILRMSWRDKNIIVIDKL